MPALLFRFGTAAQARKVDKLYLLERGVQLSLRIRSYMLGSHGIVESVFGLKHNDDASSALQIRYCSTSQESRLTVIEFGFDRTCYVRHVLLRVCSV